MLASMVMEKNAMPNDIAKRGVITGANTGEMRAFSLPNQPSPTGAACVLGFRHRPDGLRQNVVHQVLRWLDVLKTLQPVHAGRGFLIHGRAGRARLLVSLEGRQRRAVQRGVEGVRQQGLELHALHSGFGFAVHQITCL